jgi:hypothetical protein
MWTQVFLISFFVLLVVIAVILLTLEKSKLQSGNERNAQNFMDAQANAVLISMLRTPVSFTAADGTRANAPLADVIIMNFDGKYDTTIKDALQKILPKDTYIRLVIHYPDGRWTRYEERENTLDQGSGIVTLPGYNGNIKIELSLKKLLDGATTIPVLEMDNEKS